MSRRKPKTLAQEAQKYGEAVVKRLPDGVTTMGDFKLELVLAYMAGPLHSAAQQPAFHFPAQKPQKEPA